MVDNCRYCINHNDMSICDDGNCKLISQMLLYTARPGCFYSPLINELINRWIFHQPSKYNHDLW